MKQQNNKKKTKIFIFLKKIYIISLFLFLSIFLLLIHLFIHFTYFLLSSLLRNW